MKSVRSKNGTDRHVVIRTRLRPGTNYLLAITEKSLSLTMEFLYHLSTERTRCTQSKCKERDLKEQFIFIVCFGLQQNVVIMEKVEIFDTPTLRTTANITQHSPASVPAVFAEMMALQDISQLKINSVFTVRSRTGELQAALYNSTLGLCEFLEHPFRNRLLQIIQLELIRHSNIPTKCPMRAGLYYIRNASFARARIPSFLPASYFRVDVNLLNTNPWQTLLGTRWYGKLIKK